jgi:hypothetical protein
LHKPQSRSWPWNKKLTSEVDGLDLFRRAAQA